MQQFYNMADAAIVGKFVGTGALAAVGATGSILFLVIGFVDGMCAGLCIPIARSFGADDHPLLRRCLAHAVYLSVFFAILLTAVTSLSLQWLLTAMNTPADIFADSRIYLRIIFLGIPATIFYNLTAGLLRALGNSRTPLLFLIFASCLNIVLDLVLVLAFGLGVMGVGLATVTSQLAAALGCFFYIWKHYPMLRLCREELTFDQKITWRMLLSGLPMALQYSITAIGSVLIQISINNLGSLLVASVTAGLKIHQIALLPINTLGAAMATWAGQNIGAGNLERVQDGVKMRHENPAGVQHFHRPSPVLLRQSHDPALSGSRRPDPAADSGKRPGLHPCQLLLLYSAGHPDRLPLHPAGTGIRPACHVCRHL